MSEINLEQAVESISKSNKLFDAHEEFNKNKNFVEYQKNKVIECDEKIKGFIDTVEKAVSKAVKNDKDKLNNFKKLYTLEKTNQNGATYTQPSYKKFKEVVNELLDNPQNIVKGLSKDSQEIKFLKTQEVPQEAIQTINRRNGHHQKHQDNLKDLTETVSKNYSTAKELGMIKEFNAFTHSQDKFNTKLVRDYNNARKIVKQAEKTDLSQLEKVANKYGMNIEKTTAKHTAVEKIASAKFKKAPTKTKSK